MSKYKQLDLGPLPVETINRTLETELEPGEVRLSVTAHRHIAEKHPSDYPLVMAHIGAAISSPTYIGQAPHQSENFEVVKRVRVAGRAEHILIAIGLEPDDRGAYRVRSGYVLTPPERVESRRQAGQLLTPK